MIFIVDLKLGIFEHEIKWNRRKKILEAVLAKLFYVLIKALITLKKLTVNFMINIDIWKETSC